MLAVIATIDDLLLTMFGNGTRIGSHAAYCCTDIGRYGERDFPYVGRHSCDVLAMEARTGVNLMLGLRHPDLGSIRSLNL